MGVRYDRNHYDADYVKREIFGTRDGLDRGYMFWNNSGRYVDISPDPGTAESPWKNQEAPPTRKIFQRLVAKILVKSKKKSTATLKAPKSKRSMMMT